MYHVGFDVSTLDQAQISGVGIYMSHLVKHMAGASGSIQVHPFMRWSRYKKRKVAYQHLKMSPELPLKAWLWPSLKSMQLWHGPDFRIPIRGRFKKVVTIHDVAFIEEGMTSPEFAKKRRQLLKESLLGANPDAVIAVSSYTKQRLLELFPQLENRTHVVHLGADHLLEETSDIAPYAVEKPYFLFVGNLEVRKNIVGLLQAFEEYCRLSAECDLYLVGRQGYGYAEIEKTLNQFSFPKRIKKLGYMTLEELRLIYKNAKAFVYPSLHEGFGIPILEAMALSCPVLTSSQTATAEVAGNAALLVNPLSKEEIVKGLCEIQKAELREGLIEKGRRRVQSFTWENTATNTLKIYESLLSH